MRMYQTLHFLLTVFVVSANPVALLNGTFEVSGKKNTHHSLEHLH